MDLILSNSIENNLIIKHKPITIIYHSLHDLYQKQVNSKYITAHT